MRFLLRCILLGALAFAPLHAAGPGKPLPYRFLLVVGDQWEDDTSTLIHRPADFQVVAALLTSWGLPFDILRLDQQPLDAYHVLDREGGSRYGTILWMADPELSRERGTGFVSRLVRDHGASLVAIGDTVQAPGIAELAGVRYETDYKLPDGLEFTRGHFITRGLEGRDAEFTSGASYGVNGTRVTAPAERIHAVRGSAPFLTARQVDGGGRVVWLGADRSVAQLEKQIVRDLLKRALVWAQGFALYAEYERSVILFLDDFGTSEKTVLAYWHYKTPTEEEIRDGMIEPMKRHGAVMDLNVITGFADRKTRRILVPWTQRIADELDGRTVHDFASTRRGIEAGVKAGVFQIESHGWTHMLPDLESPPGPWWTAPLDGVASLDWYNEFGDRLRSREIPAAIQQDHLRRSIEHIEEDFGVRPLVLRPGGSLFSHAYASNTSRIAAQLGFAITTGSIVHFLSPERVILLEPISRKLGWAFNRPVTAAGMPWTIDAPQWIGSHDRDLAMDSGSFARLLEELGPGVRYMSGREYAAYMHARVRRDDGEGLALTIDYDPHYCAFFADHPSRWTLHVSDETRQSLNLGGEKQVIELPKGARSHGIRAK